MKRRVLLTALAAALNLSIGVIVLLLVKTGEIQERVGLQVEKKTFPETFGGEPLSRAALRFVLFGFGLSGFASMVYEVTWSRVLAMILDSSTYAFTIMLTTFLIGIALGSFLMSKAVDRLPRPLLAFILLEGAIGASAFLGLFLFAELPYLFLVLYRSFSDSLNLIFLAKFLLAFLVMLLPTLLIGGPFPLVVRIYTSNLNRVGRSIGEVYSLNTLGNKEQEGEERLTGKGKELLTPATCGMYLKICLAWPMGDRDLYPPGQWGRWGRSQEGRGLDGDQNSGLFRGRTSRLPPLQFRHREEVAVGCRGSDFGSSPFRTAPHF